MTPTFSTVRSASGVGLGGGFDGEKALEDPVTRNERAGGMRLKNRAELSEREASQASYVSEGGAISEVRDAAVAQVRARFRAALAALGS